MVSFQNNPFYKAVLWVVSILCYLLFLGGFFFRVGTIRSSTRGWFFTLAVVTLLSISTLHFSSLLIKHQIVLFAWKARKVQNQVWMWFRPSISISFWVLGVRSLPLLKIPKASLTFGTLRSLHLGFEHRCLHVDPQSFGFSDCSITHFCCPGFFLWTLSGQAGNA